MREPEAAVRLRRLRIKRQHARPRSERVVLTFGGEERHAQVRQCRTVRRMTVGQLGQQLDGRVVLTIFRQRDREQRHGVRVLLVRRAHKAA
jgi:hypothetical protein